MYYIIASEIIDDNERGKCLGADNIKYEMFWEHNGENIDKYQ